MRERMGTEEESPDIPAVNVDAGDRGKEKARDLARKADHTEEERRAAQAVDEPAHRGLLHPGTDERDPLAAKKES